MASVAYLDRKMREIKDTGKIAGAPISWGVCEVPGWGYQLSPAPRGPATKAVITEYQLPRLLTAPTGNWLQHCALCGIFCNK